MTRETTTSHRRPPALPSDLNALNTVMAADRTLMAWIRTSLAMLSFGFTIYRFLEDAVGPRHLAHPDSPRQVGLFLTGLGAVSMVLGTLSYWSMLKDIRRIERFRMGRMTLVIAIVIALAGVAMFAAIALRIV